MEHVWAWNGKGLAKRSPICVFSCSKSNIWPLEHPVELHSDTHLYTSFQVLQWNLVSKTNPVGVSRSDPSIESASRQCWDLLVCLRCSRSPGGLAGARCPRQCRQRRQTDAGVYVYRETPFSRPLPCSDRRVDGNRSFGETGTEAWEMKVSHVEHCRSPYLSYTTMCCCSPKARTLPAEKVGQWSQWLSLKVAISARHRWLSLIRSMRNLSNITITTITTVESTFFQ